MIIGPLAALYSRTLSAFYSTAIWTAKSMISCVRAEKGIRIFLETTFYTILCAKSDPGL
jgi:hypothetical protein